MGQKNDITYASNCIISLAKEIYTKATAAFALQRNARLRMHVLSLLFEKETERQRERIRKPLPLLCKKRKGLGMEILEEKPFARRKKCE